MSKRSDCSAASIAFNCKLSLDRFDVISSSVIVTPFADTVGEVSTVNVPAAGVAAPITVPSIAPPSISTSDLNATFPVPLAFNSKSELLAVGWIVLSVKFMFESIVKFVILTEPVPAGIKTMSEFEYTDTTTDWNTAYEYYVKAFSVYNYEYLQAYPTFQGIPDTF